MPTNALKPQATSRSTESRPFPVEIKGSVETYKNANVNRGRGRPAGSKNKAKSFMPKELAVELLGIMQESLPPEHYEYLRAVVRDGKAVSTEKEVDIMLLMLGRNLLPALLDEMKPKKRDLPPELLAELGEADAPSRVEFRKDVTERLKAWTSLANLKHNIDKSKNDDQSDASEKPIVKIFTRSGLGRDSIAVLIGQLPDSMGGNANGTGREIDQARTVSDQLPERPLLLSYSEQEPSGRTINIDSDRDDTLGVYEEEL